MNIACLPGYRIVGQGPYDRLFQITCNADATWDDVESCTRKIFVTSQQTFFNYCAAHSPVRLDIETKFPYF